MSKDRQTKVGPGRPKNPEITQLSDDFGVSRARAAQLKRDNADAKSPKYSKKMAAARLAIAENRAQITGTDAEMKKRELAALRGETKTRAEVRAEGAACGAVLSSALAGFASTLPSMVAGRSELEIANIIRDEIDKLIRELRASFQDLTAGQA